MGGSFPPAMDFHWLRLRATVHPTESFDRVRTALANVAHVEDEGLEERLRTTPIDMHHGGVSQLLELELHRNRDCRRALDAMLAGQAEAVLSTLGDRIDEDGVLYLRLDKQEALAGNLVLGVFDDPVSVRVKVQVHPSGHAQAVAAWTAWLRERASPAL